MAAAKATSTPFLSRAYGGYTRAQDKFIQRLIGTPRNQTILDPMAGQGFALSKYAADGATVQLGDTNPAALLLATLRDPSLIERRLELIRSLKVNLAKLRKRRRRRNATSVTDSWIAPHLVGDLEEYARLADIGLFANPFDRGKEFWLQEEETRFAAAIAVLAARDIASFRTSDNVAWLKPGGFVRERDILPALEKALTCWSDYASRLSKSIEGKPKGRIISRLMNVVSNDFGELRSKATHIITSPPYANRLDYTRLWAPEIHVLAAMCGRSVDRLGDYQIGTTAVEGLEYIGAGERRLPRPVRSALNEIKEDPSDYSMTYYYPFFRNYAITLMDALINISKHLKTGGTFVVFVRDTVRKDVLFPTGELVTRVLTGSDCRLKVQCEERLIIKSHIGFLRKATSRGLYGLAQQEWWLAFRKP
jgi:hypothetical protein